MTFFFFFSSRRRHTRSKRDWSSDVCSSDLRLRRADPAAAARPATARGELRLGGSGGRDRKSVVKGKSVDLGGGRISKKKQQTGGLVDAGQAGRLAQGQLRLLRPHPH